LRGMVLPWIFGFPNAFDPVQRKQGPGNLLNPAAADPKRQMFALKFAIKLKEGGKVSDAVRNACNEVFSGKSAEVDDKTLRIWLQKEFGLQRQPSDVDGWKKAAHEHLLFLQWLFNRRKKSRETFS
jgi:hypothetical protein